MGCIAQLGFGFTLPDKSLHTLWLHVFLMMSKCTVKQYLFTLICQNDTQKNNNSNQTSKKNKALFPTPVKFSQRSKKKSHTILFCCGVTYVFWVYGAIVKYLLLTVNTQTYDLSSNAIFKIVHFYSCNTVKNAFTNDQNTKFFFSFSWKRV